MAYALSVTMILQSPGCSVSPLKIMAKSSLQFAYFQALSHIRILDMKFAYKYAQMHTLGGSACDDHWVNNVSTTIGN